jgi:hypothetical protein
MSTTMTPTSSVSVASVVPQPKRLDASMATDLARIRGEYVEMPGLVLTLPQAARLWGFSARRVAELLAALVDSGFLACDKQRSYRRRR